MAVIQSTTECSPAKCFTVYVVTNAVNDKRYVGVTSTTLKRRWGNHVKAARHGSHYWLHQAIRKYGPETFLLEEIACTFNWPTTETVERAMIWLFGSLDKNGRGYNNTLGGDGNSRVWTEEQRQKHSERQRLMSQRPEVREANRQKAIGNRNRKGKKNTAEHIAKHKAAITKLYLTFNGETLSCSDWEKRTGIKRRTIHRRVASYGWSVEKALTTLV